MPPLVLLTEDNALVGLDIRDGLEEAGYEVAGPFGRSVEALDWLRHGTADLAVIDLQLADGPAHALTTALRQRGIPFLVYSGRSRDDDLARDVQDAPWLEKPAPTSVVVALLRTMRPPTERADPPP